MKIIIWLFVIILTSTLVAKHYDDKQRKEVMEELKYTSTQINNLKEQQDNTAREIEKLKESIISSMGKASWYDYVLPNGWSSKGHRVCASRQFERKTTIRVINLANGKSIDCLVTDYGPDESIHPDRIVDMSSYAFSQIAETHQGIINVQVLKVQ